METAMAYPAKRNPGRCPTHPGELLREDILPALKMTKVEVADALGIDRVLIHPLAGVLSAYGMGLAELRALRECSVEKTRPARRTKDGASATLLNPAKF